MLVLNSYLLVFLFLLLQNVTLFSAKVVKKYESVRQVLNFWCGKISSLKSGKSYFQKEMESVINWGNRIKIACHRYVIASNSVENHVPTVRTNG
jgi:hypothetical protein